MGGNRSSLFVVEDNLVVRNATYMCLPDHKPVEIVFEVVEVEVCLVNDDLGFNRWKSVYVLGQHTSSYVCLCTFPYWYSSKLLKICIFEYFELNFDTLLRSNRRKISFFVVIVEFLW